MSNNPINLAARFILEMGALFSLGYWGWSIETGVLRFVLAFLIPALAAAMWGLFRVPGDASHSGDAPIRVPGFIRLMIEALLFSSATWAFYNLGHVQVALIFGLVVIVHYLLSWDRILWLLRS